MPPMPPETKAMRGMIGRERSRQVSCEVSGSMISASLPIWFSFFQCSTACLWRVLALHCERHTHATPDTKRRKAFPCAALLHLVKQRDQDAAAGGADRMAERDRAAVHVHLLRIPAHLPVHRDCL